MNAPIKAVYGLRVNLLTFAHKIWVDKLVLRTHRQVTLSVLEQVPLLLVAHSAPVVARPKALRAMWVACTALARSKVVIVSNKLNIMNPYPSGHLS